MTKKTNITTRKRFIVRHVTVQGKSKMIDIKLLKKRCHQSIFQGEYVYTLDGPYVFIDNGADILAVAHLDTVLNPLMFISYPGFVVSPVLDDRLGVHIILDVLPKLDLKYDILLTTGEEHCNSTAQHFVAPRQYKWMFEFDRRGTDVVLYQYENGKTIDAVQSVGAVIGLGSYTDLVDLDHLGCTGFNWGCAYNLEHTYRCYVDLESCKYMIGLFVDFYWEYRDTVFKHTAGYDYYKSKYYGYDWDDKDDLWEYRHNDERITEDCEWCGSPDILQDSDVDGINARLCRDCIDYWNKYKDEEYYG